VFDISNGTVVREVGGPAPDKGFPANTASSLVSSPDQTMLAVVNGNNPPHTVTLYDTANWKEIGDLPQASARSPFIPNQGLAFSHDGKVIAAVTTAGTITVYDVQTRQVIRSIRAFSYPGPIPHWVAFDPDAELVAAGSENILKRANEGYPKDTIRIFRTSDGAITATYAEPLPGLLRGMWSPAGAFLALLTRDGIYLWDPHQRKNAVRTTGVNDGVFDLQFSPDGSMLAVANGKSVTLFKVQP
jgi:WD40 repeat protein